MIIAKTTGIDVVIPVEDADSRVAVLRTAWDDLRGLLRVGRAKATGTAGRFLLPRGWVFRARKGRTFRPDKEMDKE